MTQLTDRDAILALRGMGLNPGEVIPGKLFHVMVCCPEVCGHLLINSDPVEMLRDAQNIRETCPSDPRYRPPMRRLVVGDTLALGDIPGGVIEALPVRDVPFGDAP